eukprot:3745976-Pyramimonas_sp.AAC.1
MAVHDKVRLNNAFLVAPDGTLTSTQRPALVDIPQVIAFHRDEDVPGTSWMNAFDHNWVYNEITSDPERVIAYPHRRNSP